MAVIGYARVSTTDQDLSIQETALRAAGRDVIRAEKRSGTTTQRRDELRIILDFLHAGDVLMVTRIDRLARSIADLQDIVRQVRARGAGIAWHRRGPAREASRQKRNDSGLRAESGSKDFLHERMGGRYDAAFEVAEAAKPRGRHIANPANATIRKRVGSSSPWLAAPITSVAMSSRTTSGWLMQ
jgi:hypothetical protein